MRLRKRLREGAVDGGLRLTLHTPNESEKEHPVFFRVEDNGDRLDIVG